MDKVSVPSSWDRAHRLYEKVLVSLSVSLIHSPGRPCQCVTCNHWTRNHLCRSLKICKCKGIWS